MDEPKIQRRSVLNAFHNDVDDRGQLQRHDFRYVKTDNTDGEKIGVTKWVSAIADVDGQPRETTAGSPAAGKKRGFYSVKENNVILIRETPASKKPKALKFRLLTHYRPHGSSTWFRIIHPTD
jgi:hypothetical protein